MLAATLWALHGPHQLAIIEPSRWLGCGCVLDLLWRILVPVLRLARRLVWDFGLSCIPRVCDRHTTTGTCAETYEACGKQMWSRIAQTSAVVEALTIPANTGTSHRYSTLNSRWRSYARSIDSAQCDDWPACMYVLGGSASSTQSAGFLSSGSSILAGGFTAGEKSSRRLPLDTDAERGAARHITQAQPTHRTIGFCMLLRNIMKAPSLFG